MKRSLTECLALAYIWVVVLAVVFLAGWFALNNIAFAIFMGFILGLFGLIGCMSHLDAAAKKRTYLEEAKARREKLNPPRPFMAAVTNKKRLKEVENEDV